MTDAEPERTLADIIRTGTTIEVKAASDALIAKHGRDIADRLWAEACDDVGRARAIAEMPLPADEHALAKFLESDDNAVVNGMYDRLVAELGQERATELWSAACRIGDHDSAIADAVARLGSALAAINLEVGRAASALRKLTDGEAWHIEFAGGTPGEDIGEFLRVIARTTRAAEALHQKAAGA